MIDKTKSLVVIAVATTSINALPVYADAISPQIRDKGKVYSTEAPDTSMYGTGPAGRAIEAMTLRYEIERLLQDAKIEEAVVKARKACQLDPGDPASHLLLARALTRKFYAKQGEIDEKLLAECLYEWRLIWFHDADQWEQHEAKIEARRLGRIAKVIQKKKQEEYKARLAAKEALRKEKALAAKHQEKQQDTQPDKQLAAKETPAAGE